MKIFDDLCAGDRFIAYNALWTKLDPSSARKHGQESIALGDHGYGYSGDAICGFERNDVVRFLPPAADNNINADKTNEKARYP